MFVLLFLFWIAINGNITWEIVILGLVITSFIYWLICKFFDYSPKTDILFFKNIFIAIGYVFVLLWEIFKSNIAVIKMTFSSQIEVQPQIVYFDVPLKNDFLKVILANSITLTPGTITVDVKDNRFCVHALDYTLADGIENIVFIKLLMKVEESL